MISRLAGQLLAKEIDRAEVMTASGLAYDLAIPLTTFESLPATGQDVTLYTHVAVKEDGWQLFGFARPYDRQVFRAVLGAKGVGPSLALSLLSTLSAERLVRAIRDRDIHTLRSVPRVGKKTADQLVLDLADKLEVLYDEAPTGRGPGGAVPPTVDEAVLGLTRLGYARADAERVVRAVVEGGGVRPTAELIRLALAQLR